MTAKTDNHSLGTKLALREYFLDTYHRRGALVFDACSGSSQLWRRLKVRRKIQYVPVDVKPAAGRIKVESERVLAQPGWRFAVIDADTYGLPWTHWLAILKYGPARLTVFLTIGALTMGGSKICKELHTALGLAQLKIPNAIGSRINEDFTEEMIGLAEARGWKILDLKEAVPNCPGNARYFGVRMERRS